MYRIALVVDDSFGSKVIPLAQELYVWLVESGENNIAAERVWNMPGNLEDPLLHGVTTFKRQEEEELDALIIRILDMIDEHHGEFAHEPEWSDIDVLGAIPSRAIEDAAAAYGVDRCELIPGGFRLHRSNAQ